MVQGSRAWLVAAVLSLLAIVGTYAGWRGLAEYRIKTALKDVETDVKAGRHATAARKLTALLEQRPDSDEMLYLLGVCEKARGRIDEAFAAWFKIVPPSRFAASAVRARAAAMVDQGRLSEAERLITVALEDPRLDRFDLRRFLAPLYWQEGRVDEARELVETNWESLRAVGRGGDEQAVEHVRLHVALSVGMASIDAVKTFLERAGKLDPGDDRVWLGQANLALRQGQFDQAEPLLAKCLERRPDDLSVWRSRLDWAIATNRVDAARQALARIPAAGIPPAFVARTAAWLAARRGDDQAEQAALLRLIQADPEASDPYDRLAELALRGKQPERAAQLRLEKQSLDQSKLQFQALFRRDQPVRDAVEMAGLADRLGRSFEAQVYRAIAVENSRNRDAPRPIPAKIARSAPPSGTLADLLADDLAPPSLAPEKAPVHSRPGASSVVRFDNAAARGGLVFSFDNGESSTHQIPEVSSGGVGLLDYDGDGQLDVYAIQGGPFPPPAKGARTGDRLFRNRGDGTFDDVTDRSGIARLPGGYGHGIAVGDYDNDGHPDVFLTRWRSYVLLHNQGDGTFRDVTEPAGFSGDRDWPTSAAFADLDNDGDLDLYVCHYLSWDAEKPRLCKDPARGTFISCDPKIAPSLADHVFRNDNGRFTDVTAQAGFVDPDGRGFGVVAVDVDDDNLVDLFVANDMSANYLFHNLGGFRFEERGLLAGLACNAQGGNQAGMGVAAGDVDGDGRVDFAVTNFYNESTSLFQNLGDGQFADHTAPLGLALPTKTLLGFGVALLDADDDGRLDLLSANGHVNDYRPEIPYAMPLLLMLGGPGGRFQDATPQAGQPFSLPHIARGLATGDIDNDGRVDAVVVAHGEPLILLHNQSRGGHSMTFQLQGSTSNRDGVGARIEVEAQDTPRQVAWRQGGGSFLSASDPRIHFGMGTATKADRVTVRWPSGQTDHWQDLETGKVHILRESPRGDTEKKAQAEPRPSGRELTRRRGDAERTERARQGESGLKSPRGD